LTQPSWLGEEAPQTAARRTVYTTQTAFLLWIALIVVVTMSLVPVVAMWRQPARRSEQNHCTGN
jgi:hypothetical protein